MTDPASSYIWMPSTQGVANSRPGYLLGLPLFLSDKCATLGSRGDLVLADMSNYAIAVAEQVVLEKSEAPKFYQDIYSFRAILRASGEPLMDEKIKAKNGGAEMSWAVVLN